MNLVNIYAMFVLLILFSCCYNTKLQKTENKVGWGPQWQMLAQNGKVLLFNKEKDCLARCEKRNECYSSLRWGDTIHFLHVKQGIPTTVEKYFCLVKRAVKDNQFGDGKFFRGGGADTDEVRRNLNLFYFKDLCNSYCQSVQGKRCGCHKNSYYEGLAICWYRCG